MARRDTAGPAERRPRSSRPAEPTRPGRPPRAPGTFRLLSPSFVELSPEDADAAIEALANLLARQRGERHDG